MKNFILAIFIVACTFTTSAQTVGGSQGGTGEFEGHPGLGPTSVASMTGPTERDIPYISNQLLYSQYVGKKTDAERAQSIKDTLDLWGLNKPEHKTLRDKVIQQTTFNLATDKVYEPGATPEPDNSLDKFATAISSLNYKLPENIEQLKKINELNNKNLDSSAYVKNVKEILSSDPETYRNLLQKRINESLSLKDPDMGPLLEEYVKNDIDYDQLKTIMEYAYFRNDIDTVKFLAKHYDFDYINTGDYTLTQPYLCNSITNLEATFAMQNSVEAANYGFNISIEYVKERLDYEAKKAKTFIELGADPEITCHDGKTFKEKVQALIYQGADIEIDDFGIKAASEPVLAGENCLPVQIGNLEDLCNISKAILHFERVLDKNQNNNFIDGIKSGDCSLTLLTRLVEDMNGGVKRELDLRISPENSNKEFVLSVKDKEDLKKKINEFIERSKKK